jgi:hypothetical protein
VPIVYSFDVFDTALVRRTAFPSDVFRLVGQRIASEVGCPANREFIEDFVASRLQAEQMSLAGREEATLDAIWIKLRDLLDLRPPWGAAIRTRRRTKSPRSECHRARTDR